MSNAVNNLVQNRRKRTAAVEASAKIAAGDAPKRRRNQRKQNFVPGEIGLLNENPEITTAHGEDPRIENPEVTTAHGEELRIENPEITTAHGEDHRIGNPEITTAHGEVPRIENPEITAADHSEENETVMQYNETRIAQVSDVDEQYRQYHLFMDETALYYEDLGNTFNGENRESQQGKNPRDERESSSSEEEEEQRVDRSSSSEEDEEQREDGSSSSEEDEEQREDGNSSSEEDEEQREDGSSSSEEDEEENLQDAENETETQNGKNYVSVIQVCILI